MQLPDPRGPLSEPVLEALRVAPRPLPVPGVVEDEPLGGDDLHLTLYVLYELHYRGFDGVDERWEWDPSLLALRACLESSFERALRETVPAPPAEAEDMDLQLRAVIEADDAPSLSRHLETRGTPEQYADFVVHRSAYQLKEADPHSWAIPRLHGPAKAALVEIQHDEYGGGREPRMHSVLFHDTMEALGLDGAYGAYLDVLPGVTLATVNLMSLFGLHRRLRGALVGHLAAFEMTSAVPNRRYANGLRRLGAPAPALAFYDEHVEADSVHENVAANDLAGSLAAESPAMAAQVLYGARALIELEARFAAHLLEAWQSGRSSLRDSTRLPAAATLTGASGAAASSARASGAVA